MGDFDWDEMRVVGRLDAFVWFVPFIVILAILLMNMLIAIIMDAYEEVIASLEGAKTLLDVSKDTLKSTFAKKFGQEVDLMVIAKAVTAKQDEQNDMYGTDLEEDKKPKVMLTIKELKEIM